MIQALNSHGRKYAFGRDILNLFFDVAANAMARLTTKTWSGLIKDYAEHYNLSDPDFVQGALALRAFYDSVCRDSSRSMADLMTNAGFDKLPHPVMMSLFTEIGFGFMAAFYTSAQAATRMNASMPMHNQLADIVDRAAFAAKADLAHVRERRAQEMAPVSAEAAALNKDQSRG